MRFLGCTCVTDQLRVPNAVITLARLSLTENGRSRSRKKTQFSVDDREKKRTYIIICPLFCSSRQKQSIQA